MGNEHYGGETEARAELRAVKARVSHLEQQVEIKEQSAIALAECSADQLRKAVKAGLTWNRETGEFTNERASHLEQALRLGCDLVMSLAGKMTPTELQAYTIMRTALSGGIEVKE